MFDEDIIRLEDSIYKNDFEREMQRTLNKLDDSTIYPNSKSSIKFIIEETGAYFINLSDTFLGNQKGFGIPSAEADHFANNIYRLKNALKGFSEYIDSGYVFSEEFKQLIDIRTLIVHSGENISTFESELFSEKKQNGYKDFQFNGILRKGGNFSKFPDGQKYNMHIGADKHDRGILKRRNNRKYYNQTRENQLELDIYFNYDTIQKIVFTELLKFNNQTKEENYIKNRESPTRKQMNDGMKNQIFQDKINFDKLIEIVERLGDDDSGYIKEAGYDFSYLFGIKRLYEYLIEVQRLICINERADISETTLKIIDDEINSAVHEYVDWFNDNELGAMPTLNVLDIFKEYLPEYEDKYYFENDKLFNNIATSFNTSISYGHVDIDYLFKFVSEINKQLGVSLRFTGDENALVCEYIVESVETFNDRIVR